VTLQIAGLIILLVLAVLGTAFIPRYWSTPAAANVSLPALSSLGLGRGFVRSLLASVIAGWFLILASFGILLADRKVIDATVPVLFGFGFCLGFFRFRSPSSTGRKSSCRLPLRDQPGAVRVWLRNR
jgi:hypothetical protein